MSHGSPTFLRSDPATDVIRDWDFVREHEVHAPKGETNAIVDFFFRSWPAADLEASLTKAARMKTLTRVVEGTNVLAEGTVLGGASRPKPEGGNLFGLMLRFDSMRDAQAAARRIRHDPDTEFCRRVEDMRRGFDDGRTWR
jgi:hypothetical protein